MICIECGSEAKEMHHVIPRSKGGKSTIPLCNNCHSKAHGMRVGKRDLHNSLVKDGLESHVLKCHESNNWLNQNKHKVMGLIENTDDAVEAHFYLYILENHQKANIFFYELINNGKAHLKMTIKL